MQLRFAGGPTGEEYVTREGWRLATLPYCPLHRGTRCGFARLGTYARRTPPGTRIARWYCPQGHCTFSLLPDHLAARLPGTLADLERVVDVAQNSRSLEAAADALRRDAVTLASALRWLRRRVASVRAALVMAITLLPEPFGGCAPTLGALRARLGVAAVLETLRELLSRHLPVLAAPLGLRPRGGAVRTRRGARQHDPGPDPPPAPA